MATCPWERGVPCSRLAGMSLRSGTCHSRGTGNSQWAQGGNALPCAMSDSAHLQVHKGALHQAHLLQLCKPGLVQCFCTKVLHLALSEAKEQFNTSKQGSKVQPSQHWAILSWAAQSVRLPARTRSLKYHLLDKDPPTFPHPSLLKGNKPAACPGPHELCRTS